MEARVDASVIQSEDTNNACKTNGVTQPSDKPTEEEKSVTNTDFSTPTDTESIQTEPRDLFSPDISWRSIRVVSFALGAAALTYLLSKGARAVYKRY
jgi:hypothetical protein